MSRVEVLEGGPSQRGKLRRQVEGHLPLPVTVDRIEPRA